MDQQQAQNLAKSPSSPEQESLPPAARSDAPIQFPHYFIGIDPGTLHSAMISMRVDEPGAMPVVHAAYSELDNFQVRRVLLEVIEQLPTPGKSSARASVAIEMFQSFGMSVGREVFETVLWVGRFVEIVAGRLPYNLYYRTPIKLTICGQARAKDKDIRQGLIAIWGEQGTKLRPGPTYALKSHAWSALAVVTHHLHEKGIFDVHINRS